VALVPARGHFALYCDEPSDTDCSASYRSDRETAVLDHCWLGERCCAEHAACMGYRIFEGASAATCGLLKRKDIFNLSAFPWAGFLWFGSVVGFLYVSSLQQGNERMFFTRLLIAAGALILGGLLFDNLPIQVYPHYDFWHTSPNWFAIRLGVVMLFCGSLWLLEHHAHYKSWMMAKLGQESLFVYASHLPVVYGSAVNAHTNFTMRFGQTLSALQCFALFFVLLLAVYFPAFVWNRIKKDYKPWSKLITVVAVAVFLYFFFTREY